MNIWFRELTPFSRARDEYFATDDEFRAFQNALMENPRAGVVVPGTGGVRKIRWSDARRGQGKRGGIRIIYLYIEEAALVLLLAVYGKNKVEDMSSDEKRVITALAKAVREEVLRGENI